MLCKILASIPFYYLQIYLVEVESALKSIESKLISYRKTNFLFESINISININL